MWWYDLGIKAYRAGIRIASISNPKARLWLEGRRDIFVRMRADISGEEPIVWVHASSLGEFEQGRPLIERIRADHPELKILLTFFSPSGYEVRKNYPGVDHIFYLPADTPRRVRRFLDIVRPRMAIFIKYEFWLNYLTELRKRGCRTYVVSAIFRPRQIFFRPWGGAFRRVLAGFTHIFVQNEASRELLASVGIDRVSVSGDTRFDRVAALTRASQPLPIVERFAATGPVLVAGSTWGPDEELLTVLFDRFPQLRFVVAPHEMDGGRIEQLMAAAGRAVRYTRTSADDPALDGARLLVIDTVGILSSVYRYARYAYIGGGFGAGIHNTLEAAAYGLPVAFGPNYRRFREACELIEAGAARSVASAAELEEWLAPLIADPTLTDRQGRCAAGYVASHVGATECVLSTIFPPQGSGD